MSPPFEAPPYEPRWVKVEGGNHRCVECGSFVSVAWCLFVSISTHTTTYCEPCVAKLLDG